MISVYLNQIRVLLRKAQVAPDVFDLELSHHYGIDNFARYGAASLLLSGCKIMVMLPHQTHPSHYHKIRSETYRILVGSLRVCINHGRFDTLLRVDESLDMDPRNFHEFTGGPEGAVLVETFANPVSGDSYYADPTIANDPRERKTTLAGFQVNVEN